ncbi:hypothetical protein F0562_020162 [Nyssa sinensis]|uniref:RWP-RK domain-containing protein n=1 Tax=Nyssa sinensis TaxID=561372 RepID=A0A5J5BR98_9ASTE|nr:hypothetical protein F0562_020162 [Nyssa sinensis]
MEPSSNYEYQKPVSDVEFYKNRYILSLNESKENLFHDLSTDDEDLLVLWNSTRTPCLPPPDSVGIEDKIRSALHKLSFGPVHDPMLIQFWAAVTNEGRCFLTTLGQPFGLYHFRKFSENLCWYRNHSSEYKFFVDGESEEELGFPARVYRQKRPESTPNVQYYSTKQHPWCDRALDCEDLELLALPVFEAFGNFCAGVLEIVGDSLYPDDIEAIYGALEAAHLKSLERRCNHFDWPQLIIRNEGLGHALCEIREGLEVVCKTHELPFAQTWVLCKDCNDGARSSFPNDSPRIAFSRTNAYVDDDDSSTLLPWATDALNLQKDEGVVWRAYLGSHNTSFCRDITQFSITEYPMVHYARHHKLFGCFASCLKSSDTGDDKYVLEFFLPQNERFYEHPRPHILDKILATMKEHLPNLKTASGKPVGVELVIEEVSFSMANKHDSLQICQNDRSLPRAEALQNGEDTAQVNSSDQQLIEQDDAIDNGKNIGSAEQSDAAGTNSGKKSTKREPKITYEDLRKYFGRKLDDVAEIFDVSRSTFKRICRENGIQDWPRPRRRRKRDKINDSLSMQDPPPQVGQATVAHTRLSAAVQDGCTDTERRFTSHPPLVNQSSDLIEECMTILNKIEGINETVYLKAVEILDDYKRRKFFFNMREDMRKNWILSL